MTCSVAWDAAGLPAWGTAPEARFWLALEQNGPWGSKAFVQSRLDPRIGAAIESAAAAAGGRALLIRRPASHADHAGHPRRRVYLAGGLHEVPWLVAGQVPEPADLLDLPWERLAWAERAEVLASVPWLEPVDGGVLLICANGKRDLCCALRGRPIALQLESARPGRVWECTHTGGHRFAPTGIVLPSGQSLARLTPELALAALVAADAGRLSPETFGPWHDRGRGHLPAAAAVADAHVRAVTGEVDPGALTACAAGQGAEVHVRHRDGRSWTVEVSAVDHPAALPESCVKAPVPARSWSARIL